MAIRAAILGYGRSGGSMHAGALERNDRFEVTAVCDIDAERQRQASDRFGCIVYDEYEQMLRLEHLDLVIIVTRSDQHCRMACDCLEAGVNVLVTKPWAVNAAEARETIAAAERSGRMLLPWLPARWGCDLRRLRALLDEKAVGNVFLVRRAVSCFATRCDWQTERRFGGGYLLNWGPHIVDPPVVLMRSPVRSVYAQMRQVINPGDTEDVFLALMTLADGTLVQAEHTVTPEEPPGWFIQGDRGAIVVRGRHLRVHRRDLERPDDPTAYRAADSGAGDVSEETLEGSLYGDEHEVYDVIARALAGEAPYPVRPEDALDLSETLDAIRRSADENRVVTL